MLVLFQFQKISHRPKVKSYYWLPERQLLFGAVILEKSNPVTQKCTKEL